MEVHLSARTAQVPVHLHLLLASHPPAPTTRQYPAHNRVFLQPRQVYDQLPNWRYHGKGAHLLIYLPTPSNLSLSPLLLLIYKFFRYYQDFCAMELVDGLSTFCGLVNFVDLNYYSNIALLMVLATCTSNCRYRAQKAMCRSCRGLLPMPTKA